MVVTVISCHTFFLGGGGKTKSKRLDIDGEKFTPKSSTKISRLTADAKNVFQHPCHISPEFSCPSQSYRNFRSDFLRVEMNQDQPKNDPADTSTASQKIENSSKSFGRKRTPRPNLGSCSWDGSKMQSSNLFEIHQNTILN